MRTIIFLMVLLTSLICIQTLKAETNERFRVIVLTDIENEPDEIGRAHV